MDKPLKYVEEKMDQSELYVTFIVNFIKATIVMSAVFLTGWLIISYGSQATEMISGTFWLSLVITYVILAYIFRPLIYTDEAKKSNWVLGKNAAWWFLGAVVYNLVMYIGGEIIFIGLVALGIILMVIFLGGDSGLTTVFTYVDLVKWAKEKSEKETSE